MAGGCAQSVRDGSVDKLSLSTTKLELGRVRASLRDLFFAAKVQALWALQDHAASDRDHAKPTEMRMANPL